MKEHAMASRGAAEWFMAIKSSEDTDADTLQAWLRWLESSDDNRRAFEEIAQVWHGTPAAVIARQPDLHEEEDYDGSIPIAQWRANKQKARVRFVPVWRRPVAAAAAVLIATGLIAYRQLSPPPLSSGEFATRTAEHRELRLADGSRVTLGGHSRLTVDLKPTIREVRLQSGEAYFSVDKDPARPFVVLALEGAVTALGTSFNVRTLEDRLTVTVTEGSVKVTDEKSARGDGGQALEIGRLERGEQLTWRPNKSAAAAAMAKIERVDIATSARWREGWFVYRNEPLKDVVADMSRYTDLKLQVAASAANVQFSGAVSKDRIGEWIAALPEVAKVSVSRDEQGFTIDSRPAP